jgi:hypothetical protein
MQDAQMTSFPVWKTVKPSRRYRRLDTLRGALAEAGVGLVNEKALNCVLDGAAFRDSHTKISAPEKIELIRVTMEDLGLKMGSIFQILDRGRELGLELCPALTGPLLRLEYSDQPLGEWLRIATSPMEGLDGAMFIFSVDRTFQGSWLGVSPATAQYSYWTDVGFVFSRACI